MNYEYDVLHQSRKNVLMVVEQLTTEQFNKIPDGFNNNIIWNIGHLLVTQQLLVHKLGNGPMYVSKEEVDQFRKGSKPEKIYSTTEIQDIKNRLMSIIELSKNDYDQGNFGAYHEYTTSYGMTMKSVEEAITFNNTHEGLHLGCVLTMRRLV